MLTPKTNVVKPAETDNELDDVGGPIKSATTPHESLGIRESKNQQDHHMNGASTCMDEYCEICRTQAEVPALETDDETDSVEQKGGLLTVNIPWRKPADLDVQLKCEY
jgi:hypothetical protein